MTFKSTQILSHTCPHWMFQCGGGVQSLVRSETCSLHTNPQIGSYKGIWLCWKNMNIQIGSYKGVWLCWKNTNPQIGSYKGVWLCWKNTNIQIGSYKGVWLCWKNTNTQIGSYKGVWLCWKNLLISLGQKRTFSFEHGILWGRFRISYLKIPNPSTQPNKSKLKTKMLQKNLFCLKLAKIGMM